MIAVPYHLGCRDVEVGRGPTKLRNLLAQPSHIVERVETGASQMDAMIEVNLRLAEVVRAHQGPPLILAGSCNLGLGALAGLEEENLGIVWFDAHGDFNTPASSSSGRLDGMALAVATGVCHTELRQRIGLDRPIPGAKTLLLEPRDLDPGEGERIGSAGVHVLRLTELEKALTDLDFEAVYLHIDLDVLNPGISPGVNCTKPGGIAPDQLYETIRLIGTKLPLAAATIANYNPDRDPEDRTLRIAARLAELIIQRCGLS